ncbi:hypothetical protein [Streptomyces qinzhouensis]|uniref:hypothetical protein n=1 Tax=Streptomyces qinzhouensis TaxID=2599401 RepID=UPI001FE805B0|nr:hypothetical protein [Streptomyces qinzhouensis]
MAVVTGGDGFRAGLDFTTGVLSLLSLTAAVAWGLIATDRLLLSPRHRLLAQAVHRATAAAALGFLVLHTSVKLTLGHVGAVGALVPFGLGFTSTEGLIGFGSLAGLLMVVAGATGALRSALAGRVRFAGRWRALHMLAYPAWCAALVHGLFAGRPAAGWVVAVYCLALLAVGGAVSLRLLPRPVQRRLAARVALLTADGTASAAPSGAPWRPFVPDASVPDDALRPVAEGTAEACSGGPAPSGSAAFPGGEPFGAVTGPGRPRPPMLVPPSPRLYEAPPPPIHPPDTSRAFTAPETVHAFVSPGIGHAFAVPGSGTGPVADTGIAAAYRAVSRPGGRGTSAPARTAAENGAGPGKETGTRTGTETGTGTGRRDDAGRTVPGLYPPRSGEPWSTPAGDRI